MKNKIQWKQKQIKNSFSSWSFRDEERNNELENHSEEIIQNVIETNSKNIERIRDKEYSDKV